MDTGLAKLEEASCSVEILKKDLAVMEQELAQASEKAEKVCVAPYYVWLPSMCGCLVCLAPWHVWLPSMCS
jgi:hypothetical protein